MHWIDSIAELLAPTRCAGCDLPGTLLCERCHELVGRFDQTTSCSRCGAPFGALVCTECWDTAHAFQSAVALGELAHPLSRAVVLHKDAGERRLGAELGGMLASVVRQRWPSRPDAVTWVPSTPAALARRGFDHARSIAEPVAAAYAMSAEALLERVSGADQRVLGRAARARNAAHTFSASGENAGLVLLVDDVLTTGATLDAAANELLSAGAREVRVAVLARAW